MNSWEKNSISPEFHPATKPLTVEPVDSGNEIARQQKGEWLEGGGGESEGNRNEAKSKLRE